MDGRAVEQGKLSTLKLSSSQNYFYDNTKEYPITQRIDGNEEPLRYLLKKTLRREPTLDTRNDSH